MKISRHPSPGVALVIVLGFLVIISALAVAFFSSINTEMKASRNFAAGITTRQLSDSAVEIVKGQIAAATTRGIDAATGQGNEAWASQPGMIRVFGTNTGSGSTASSNADAFYKLYSSDQMILTAAAGNLAGFDPMGQNDLNKSWDQAPALWTDLNTPVIVRDAGGSATPRFPIIDPRAYNKTIDPAATNNQHKWDANDVEGFYYDTTSGVDQLVGPGGDPDKQRLPMPVKWIYVLQDGTLTVPNSASTTTATFTTNVPTVQNPIVGRMAFWTDDETCKLNLNTAAGYSTNLNDLNNTTRGNYQNNLPMYAGSYWDSPRFYTQFDYGQPDATGMPISTAPSGGLALCQLLENEFQRYPGHPATTSLNPVFQNLLTSQQIYAISPRYSDMNLSKTPGMSTMGGTQRIVVNNTQGDIDAKQLLPKTDRLYASVDELMFGPKLNDDFQDPNFQRPTINAYNNPIIKSEVITPQLLDRVRFFLTTDSRAPELNLYGQPRVSCWPVRAEPPSGSPSGLNVFDNLILFCSTVGAANSTGTRPDTITDQTGSGVYRYIFTRRELQSNWVASTPHSYLGDASSQFEYGAQYKLPGVGADCELSRNKTLLNSYLSSFMTRPIPGNGHQFADANKFPGGSGLGLTPTMETQQILTEIFDYIRLANSQDTTTTISSGNPIKFAPRGMVPPSQPSYFAANVKGFGRMSTICEATIVFYYAGPQMDPNFTAPAGYQANAGGWSKWDPKASAFRYVLTDNAGTAQNPQYVVHGGYMRAFMLFSTFDSMQGYAPKSDPGQTDPKMSIECTWPADWKVSVPTDNTGNSSNTMSLGFPSGTLATTVYRAPAAYWGGRNFGGYEGFMHTLQGNVPTPTSTWAPYKIKWAPGAQGALVAPPAATADFGETYNPNTQAVTKNYFVDSTLPQEYYPFQTQLDSGHMVPIPGPTGAKQSFSFAGGPLTVKVYYGGSATNPQTKPIQTFNLNFPSNSNLPIPQGAPLVLNEIKANTPFTSPTADVTTWQSMQDPLHPANYAFMRKCYWTGHGTFFDDAGSLSTSKGRANSPGSVYSYQTSLQASWSFATRLAWCAFPGKGGGVSRGDGGQSYDPFTNSSGQIQQPGYFADRWRCIVQPGDTIRSLLYWDGNDASGNSMSGKAPTLSGDLRIAQVGAPVAAQQMAPHPDYGGVQSRACVLRGGDGNFYLPQGTLAPFPMGTAAAGQDAVLGNHIDLAGGKMQTTRAFGNLPWGGGPNPSKAVNGVGFRDIHGAFQPGDWDTGLGDFPDGPFCNKQDEGNVVYAIPDYNGKLIYPIPYFTSTWAYQAPGNTFTSPSRQMPSAVMMGSLPSYALEGQGWTTLCFCPNPAGDNHPGISRDPQDHYLLDLFMMPVVEPYPISEPFSTAGKVNLNYRIVPFDYIRRSTALRGALCPMRVTAVNSQKGQAGNLANYLTYKTGDASGKPITANFRNEIDRDKTILAIDGFYNQGIGNPDVGFFKSASQICERYLYPLSYSNAYSGTPKQEAIDMRTWWNNNGDLTGDNEREKPYADLYGRVTTKSNTYTVYMKVQTLRQTPGHASTWIEGKDSILGEYRGSTIIERYVDPADPRFAGSSGSGASKTVVNPDTQSVEPLYRFRTVSNKKFNP